MTPPCEPLVKQENEEIIVKKETAISLAKAEPTKAVPVSIVPVSVEPAKVEQICEIKAEATLPVTKKFEEPTFVKQLSRKVVATPNSPTPKTNESEISQ